MYDINIIGINITIIRSSFIAQCNIKRNIRNLDIENNFIQLYHINLCHTFIIMLYYYDEMSLYNFRY